MWNEVEVVGPLDRNAGWDGARLVADGEAPETLRGAHAWVGERHVVRDPLGLNKLFYVREGERLCFAARPRHLVDAGFALDDVWSVPRGTADGRSLELPAPAEAEPSVAAEAIASSLNGYLSALAAARPSARVFVCLSGGLDSSGVASLARAHFREPVAVSFALGRASGDRLAGEQVAQELGMPLLAADAEPEELLSHLDTVLVHGVDWRDFNVHAALVNAVLGAAIRDAAGAEDVLVLTGDLPNEFLIDYEAETYRGETFYALPRLRPAALRASLVKGLDSCHREIGVFEAFGLQVIQPYAVAVDAYLSLPESFLELPDRKQRLCRAVFGDGVPDLVYDRPKARAQTGDDSGGGVLGTCIDNGVDAAFLRRRFAELHEVSDERALDRFIRAGRYRSRIPDAS